MKNKESSISDEVKKAKRNESYLAMIDKSIAEAEAGGFITKTIAELEKEEENL